MAKNIFRCVAGLCLLALTDLCAQSQTRFFQPAPGYTRAKDLPDSFSGKVSFIHCDIKDAFEGAAVHSEAEQVAFDIGNALHINTHEYVIRRRLLFHEGDTVTADMLRETEKQLRGEEFLADAILEAKRLPDSTVAIKVTTYDQWTTVPAVGLNRKGGEWVWWIGPVESNLFGTGQRLGFFVGHDLERDSRWFDYNNNVVTPWKIHVAAQYAWLSDGYSYSLSADRPLLSRTDAWSFSLSTSGTESSQSLYLSGNDLDRLQEEGRLSAAEQARLGITNVLGGWGKVDTHNAYAGVTRSFGYSLKTSITPFYQREDRYNQGLFYIPDTVIWDSLGLLRKAPALNVRHDELLGVSWSLYQYAYKTVTNFRNLKWSENIETGWRLSTAAGKNQPEFGAHNADWWFSHTAVYNNEWWNALFLNTNASLKYFWNPNSDFDNGSTSIYGESQWKPVSLTSTVLTGEYANLFATTASQRLYLGEESGLIGFPNFYYSGKARVLFSAEQRYFPPFEMGTIVPAFAVFMNAGNTYSDYRQVDLGDMHYALGIGLRLGATRSVQKVVNHINVVWPLGEKNLSAWSWGIRASKSL